MKGHIRERSPGHWAIVLDVRDVATGKRKRRWHTFTGTKRAAQIECARLISQLSCGTYLEPNKTTVAQFLDRWLYDIKPRVTPKTHERYEQVCRKNIAPLLGAVALPKLNPVQISQAYAKALASGRRNGHGGLSPRTVHHMHVILKGALAQAVKWEMLVRNPADAVDPSKACRATMQTYDLAQTAELIEAVRGKRVFVPTILAVLCGLRRGEIAALRWRNVDGGHAVGSRPNTKGPIQHARAGGRAPWRYPRQSWPTEAHRIAQAQELLTNADREDRDDASRGAGAAWARNGFASSTEAPCPASGSTICGTHTRRTCWPRAYIQRSPASALATARLASRSTSTATCCQTCRRTPPRLLTTRSRRS